MSGSTVYAGGWFTSISGQQRNHIAALDAATGAATDWNPNANDVVNALAVSGSAVYTGGGFTSVDGQTRHYIAALDATTGAPTAWDPNADGEVWALAISGSTVYAGGNFISFGGQARYYIAALNAVTGTPTAWNPNANQWVYALAVSDSTVYAVGRFTSIGGQARSRIAALDAATGSATGWNPNANGDVNTLAVSGSTVYAGGYFTNIGGQGRNLIAALDAATGAATDWDPNAVGPLYSSVHALAVSGSTVYAGGAFTTIGGLARFYVAALDAATGAATSWSPYPDGTVYALAVSGSAVYVGGSFRGIDGLPHGGIAAISTDNTTATLLAQFDATATAEGIELRWAFGDPIMVSRVAVERAPNAAGPWFPIAPELHDESGVTVALDRTTNAGGEHFYRLVVEFTNRGQLIFGPVSASIHEPLSRSDLTELAPNPTSGGTQVQYAVARSGRVRLELLDVSGRVVATLADRNHEPGRYAAVWDGSGHRGLFAPGLYYLRLTAPDHVAVRKLAIVR